MSKFPDILDSEFVKGLLNNLVEFRLLDLISFLQSWPKMLEFLPSSGIFFVRLPFSIAYFFYIYIPWLLLSWLWGYAMLFFQIICRRNKHAKRLLIHVSELLEIGTVEFPAFYSYFISFYSISLD